MDSALHRAVVPTNGDTHHAAPGGLSYLGDLGKSTSTHNRYITLYNIVYIYIYGMYIWYVCIYIYILCIYMYIYIVCIYNTIYILCGMYIWYISGIIYIYVLYIIISPIYVYLVGG